MTETSKTVLKSLDVLWSLRDDGPAHAKALASRLDVSRTVVHRLVASLERGGLVRRAEDGYRLGYGLIELASAVESELRAAARKALEVLAARFDETAVIAVRDRNEIVALDEVAPEHRIVTARYSAGVRHPVGVGAHGVVLSDSPSAGRRPYVVTRGELEAGVTGLAAPVIGVRGRPVAAVGLIAPSSRFPSIELVSLAVLDAATNISQRLAHSIGDKEET